MVIIFDGYGNPIIRGMPGERLGDKCKTKSRKSHARRQTGAIIARGIGFPKSENKNRDRDYYRLKCND